MKTVAVMLLLLTGGWAQGVQPFSWEPDLGQLRDNRPSELYSEIVVPPGMIWVVERSSGFYVSSDSQQGGLPSFAKVFQVVEGSQRQVVYISPTLLWEERNEVTDSIIRTYWAYNQEVSARYSGTVQAEGVNPFPRPESDRYTGGRSLFSLVGYLTPTLAGDYSGDGIVNAADYTVLRDNAALWEPSDLALFQSHYGSGNGSTSSPIPEPTTATLLILGVMGSGMRRQR